MATPPLIVREGELVIEYTTPTAATVDLSCYAFAVEPASDVEELDIGTFCAPSATDQGKITESIVISLLWSEDLYTALQPHIGVAGKLVYTPVAGGSKALQADVKYSTMPWGRFEIGARVEVDLPLAVLSPIIYGTVV